MDYKKLNQIIDSYDEDEDGWSEEIQDTLRDILHEIHELSYEVDNCRRGAYTNCTTDEELGNYIHALGKELIEISEYIG